MPSQQFRALGLLLGQTKMVLRRALQRRRPWVGPWQGALPPLRKKKKVSLGPVSYVLVDAEDSRATILRKGPGARRDASVQKALRGPQCMGLPASTSRGPKAKPEGSPHASKGESEKRGHPGHVSGWMGGGAGVAGGGAKEPRAELVKWLMRRIPGQWRGHRHTERF